MPPMPSMPRRPRAPGNGVRWQAIVWIVLFVVIAAVMMSDHHKRVDQARIKACLSIVDEAVRGRCVGAVGERW